jgi:cation transport regulator
MPYRTKIDLPASVRDHLPPHAQDIYRAAFNHAFAAHAGDVRQEEIAHRTALGRRQAILSRMAIAGCRSNRTACGRLSD